MDEPSIINAYIGDVVMAEHSRDRSAVVAKHADELQMDPARGAVQLNTDGSFTYTPDPDLAGPDQFTYSARDAAGSTTSATVTINVAAVNDPPTGATFVPPPCSAGVSCRFEGRADDPDQGDVLTYRWDFDGDGVPDAEGTTVDHTFPTAGVVTVTLTVTDAAGASDSHSDTFTVNP